MAGWRAADQHPIRRTYPDLYDPVSNIRHDEQRRGRYHWDGYPLTHIDTTAGIAELFGVARYSGQLSTRPQVAGSTDQ